MSVTFFVKNPSAPKIMSPKELLELQKESFVQFSLNWKDEIYDEVINSPISEYGYMLMGQEGISGRGFEVSYEEKDGGYNVRVFTPSTENDWLGAFEFIKVLGLHFGSEVVDEQGRVYAADKITYPYINDIEFGIKSIESKENYFIFGVNYPICFSKEMIDKMCSSENKVGHFSKLVEENQWVDAYIANQRFYKRNDEDVIFGSYTLTQTVKTILPYQYPPFIDIAKTSLKEDVKEWQLSLVIIDGDENVPESYKTLGRVDYKTFLERLPHDKYQKLDGHYMLVQLNSLEEMKALIEYKNNAQARETDTGFFSKIKGWFK